MAVRLLLFAGAVYLVLCALLWAVQDRMIFHPQPPGRVSHSDAEPVAIDRGDATLHGWIVNGRKDGPLLVYYGGNAEEVSEHIPGWAKLPWPTVLFNYRGFGNSTGKPSERAFVDDAVAIVDWAKEQLPNRPLVLFGLSLGSGVAVQAAAQVKPEALILVSPYRSVAHIARSRFPVFPIRWLLRHPFDAARHADEMPPTLVFASPIDRVIDFRESEAMVAALGQKAKLHAFNVVHAEFLDHGPLWDVVRDFLHRRFATGSADAGTDRAVS